MQKVSPQNVITLQLSEQWLPKDVHILIPRICEYDTITLHGKRHPASIIKLRILRWEIILDYSVEPSVTIGVLVKARQEGQNQEKAM